MNGYVVIDTEIVDPEAYSEFVDQVLAAIAAHGGRFLVRTSEAQPIEGDWAPKRFVILEFDSVEAASGFIASADYGSLDDVRRRAANSKIVVAEGFDAEA